MISHKAIDFYLISGPEDKASPIVGKPFHYKKNPRLEDLLLRYKGKNFTLENFNTAVTKTKETIIAQQRILKSKLGYEAKLLFDGYLLILEDEEFTGAIKGLIEENYPPPEAIIKVAKKFINFFYESNFEGLREKILEIRDLTNYLLFNLEEKQKKQELIKTILLLQERITPLDILRIFIYGVKAIIALKNNSTTNHTRIILHSLKLPYLEISAEYQKIIITTKDILCLDFSNNQLIVNPKKNISIKKTNLSSSNNFSFQENQKTIKTKDNHPVNLYLTINFADDLKEDKISKVKGVGLVRTEFFFLLRNAYLNQKEQITIYKKILKKAADKEVNFRLLDLGADKKLGLEENELSVELKDNSLIRGVQFLLKSKALLQTQIEALLLASKETQTSILRIIMPFVTNVEEIIQVKKTIYSLQKKLHLEEEITISLGIMVELPSVIWHLKEISEEVDFFSIGSNDLIINLLAIKDNFISTREDYFYNPLIYRYLFDLFNKLVVCQKKVIVCGQLAENPQFLEFLIGVGFANLSIDLESLPSIISKIKTISLTEAKVKVKVILAQKSSREVRKVLFE